MRETAYAKLNLALHVRGRGADGYHQLDTLFAFCEDGDVLEAEQADGLSLAVGGPFAPALGEEADNLVLRAARALQDCFGVKRGARLSLDKRLPVASGIGGGSADAAAALRLLVRLWGVGVDQTDLLALAATLGADVPACLLSRSCRGTGRGDRLTDASPGELAASPALLVNPRVPLSTAAVFRAWSGNDGGPLPADPLDARNDLEVPAIGLVPQIGDVLETLRAAPGAVLVRMSGSGATCFALFRDPAARAAADAAVAAAQPGWWRLPTRLR